MFRLMVCILLGSGAVALGSPDPTDPAAIVANNPGVSEGAAAREIGASKPLTLSEGLSSVGLIALIPPEALQAASAPRYVYSNGAQGFGYYPAQSAPRQSATVAQASRSSTVGPGSRNWATGNRVPLHRPWMRSR